VDRIRPRQLTREQLSTFLKSPELIRAFERYIEAISTSAPDQITLAQQTAQRAEALAGQALIQQIEPEDEMPQPPAPPWSSSSWPAARLRCPRQSAWFRPDAV
jgi:hypothetical protein